MTNADNADSVRLATEIGRLRDRLRQAEGIITSVAYSGSFEGDQLERMWKDADRWLDGIPLAETLYAPPVVLYAAYSDGWTLIGPVYPYTPDGEYDPNHHDAVTDWLAQCEIPELAGDTLGEVAWITDSGYVSQDEHQPPPGSWWAVRRLCPAGFAYADGHDCPTVHEPDEGDDGGALQMRSVS